MQKWMKTFFSSLCGAGVVLGTLLVAASLTPTLVLRAPLMQGALSGLCFAMGYGLGVLLRGLWRSLDWPEVTERWQQ